MMRYIAALLAAATISVVGETIPPPDSTGRYTISSAAIKAQFIPYGASLTNLWVKDKNGNQVDIILGYDNASYYPVDPGHPVYNSIPGRYVSRIGNHSYTLDGVQHITEANDGNNTLHSGTNNWSYRTWTVTALTNNSISFYIYDKSNSSLGFLGDVNATVKYTLLHDRLDIKMWADSLNQTTPLMLTHHTYYNLDAFKNPATNTIWNHTLYMPYSRRYLAQDGGAVPTGPILTAEPGSLNDFASAPGLFLGHARNLDGFSANCGPGCEGYNGYFLVDDPPIDAPVVTLASPFSGIKAELRTDQGGVVIYSCNWMDGSAVLKSDQGVGNTTHVGKSSCVAIEAQDYPNGLNHPEWNRNNEVSSPGQGYYWHSSWTYGLL